MATPHLNPLPFSKGRGGTGRADPKLTINEHYPHGKLHVGAAATAPQKISWILSLIFSQLS
jgi:hypothetical protein